jgi:hypothetical protein
LTRQWKRPKPGLPQGRRRSRRKSWKEYGESLNAEIFRLEKKRRKLPVDNLQLKEAQKAYEVSLRFIREFLKEVEQP